MRATSGTVIRMREVYDRSGSTPTVVVEGIGRTGRLVTNAAHPRLCVPRAERDPGTENKGKVPWGSAPA
jgi:hypothetical protein